MVKFDRYPSKVASWRSMRAQAEWNVQTHIQRDDSPRRSATRSFICPAALLVKVMARVC
jgi:hypothetical protein